MLRSAARTLRPVRDTTKHLRFGERSVSAILKESLTRQASLLGFDCIGVTDPGAIAQAGRHFREFLDSGAHGDMEWLPGKPESRSEPRPPWLQIRSLIIRGGHNR